MELSSLSAPWVDPVAFGACAFLLGLYQARLSWRTRRTPVATLRGINRAGRAAWVRRVMDEGLDLLAVQTLRNATMAASLMASTAVLLIFGILNLVANQDKLGGVFRALDPTHSGHPALFSFKVLAILVAFFVAFFAFSLAIRNYNHASTLVNVPRAAADEVVTPERVILVLERAALYYTVGMRSYLAAAPLILWLFGPAWMVVGTVAVLAVLVHLDHVAD